MTMKHLLLLLQLDLQRKELLLPANVLTMRSEEDDFEEDEDEEEEMFNDDSRSKWCCVWLVKGEGGGRGWNGDSGCFSQRTFSDVSFFLAGACLAETKKTRRCSLFRSFLLPLRMRGF